MLDGRPLAGRPGGVHPDLAALALPELGRHGRIALHASAVLVDGLAWAVVGTKERGKSTLVHALSRSGVPVLCDDVLVLEGRRAFVGPRCVDLRHHVEGAEPARDGRWRVTLPPAPAEAELAGFVHLEWGAEAGEPALERLEVGARLAALADPSRGDGAWRGDVELLALTSLPGFRLTRDPHGDVREVVDVLLAGLRAPAPAAA